MSGTHEQRANASPTSYPRATGSGQATGLSFQEPSSRPSPLSAIMMMLRSAFICSGRQYVTISVQYVSHNLDPAFARAYSTLVAPGQDLDRSDEGYAPGAVPERTKRAKLAHDMKVKEEAANKEAEDQRWLANALADVKEEAEEISSGEAEAPRLTQLHNISACSFMCASAQCAECYSIIAVHTCVCTQHSRASCARCRTTPWCRTRRDQSRCAHQTTNTRDVCSTSMCIAIIHYTSSQPDRRSE